MIAFSRITGLMLLVVFGSQLLFLHLREEGLKYEADLLQKSGEHGFARITRTQELNKLSPVVRPRYYFSIDGMFKNHTFHKSERVTSAFYYLYSVGSNIEIKIALLRGQRPILKIRKNPLPYGETPGLLFLLSWWLFWLGVGLTFFGFVLGPILGRMFSIASLRKTARPKAPKG